MGCCAVSLLPEWSAKCATVIGSVPAIGLQLLVSCECPGQGLGVPPPPPGSKSIGQLLVILHIPPYY